MYVFLSRQISDIAARGVIILMRPTKNKHLFSISHLHNKMMKPHHTHTHTHTHAHTHARTDLDTVITGQRNVCLYNSSVDRIFLKLYNGHTIHLWSQAGRHQAFEKTGIHGVIGARNSIKIEIQGSKQRRKIMQKQQHTLEQTKTPSFYFYIPLDSYINSAS